MYRCSTSVAIALLMLAALYTLPAHASMQDGRTLTVVAWNVESGGADPIVVGQRIADFQGVALWGLSEVNDARDGETFEAAAEVGESADFEGILSQSGGGDRLLAVYDTSRFSLLGSEELVHINIENRVRAPLVLHLQEKSSGQQLLFMVNHLYRSDDDARHTQAQLLNEWAAEQTLPVITVGDFNFDWNIHTDEHDKGYDLLTAGGRFVWVRPAPLATTQCSGWPCAFESVLDFVFVAGPARQWPAVSDIIVVDGDFPDDATTSDHRPVVAVITLPDSMIDTYLPVVLRGSAALSTPTPTSKPTATPEPTETVQPNCDPAYPTVCIQPPPPDLDCGDIPFRRFTVLPPDPHYFDGDGDGIGCEG